MKQFLTAFVLLLTVITTHGQGVRGTITSNGEPIPYAHIYVPVLSTGTITNIDGVFELQLPEGEWDITFQSLGYRTISKHFIIDNKFHDVTINLEHQNIRLGEIKVLASGEDPAYYVMRRAIAMAPYYDKQVSEYESTLYLKGSGIASKIPRMFRKKLKKEGIEENRIFIIESVNKIHFELPDKLEQQVVAIRSSGDDYNTSPLPILNVSLYNAAKYGIASPVDRNALNVYRFELIGVFEDQGRLVNKIKVTPNNKNRDRTFEGIINIIDQYWNIHSAQLSFRMSQVDVVMEQLYGLVNENVWMPTGMNFKMDMKALGFEADANYVASFSDYKIKLNEQLDHSILASGGTQSWPSPSEQETEGKTAVAGKTGPDAEDTITADTPELSKNMEKIASLMENEDMSNRDMYKLQRLLDKEAKQSLPREPLEIPQRLQMRRGAIQNDTTYWSAVRPVVLTGNEQAEFDRKKAITSSRNPATMDSLRRAKNQYRFGHVLFGKTYRFGADTTRFTSSLSIPGITAKGGGLSFNTVDGFKYALPFRFMLNDTLGRRLEVHPSVAYAFSRKTVYAELYSHYLYNGTKMGWIGLRGGRLLEDFKGDLGISPLENSIYTLFLEDNFQKFFENRYVRGAWGTEIVNGLSVKTVWGFADRLPVSNNSSFRIINRESKSLTPNIPDIPGLEPWQLERNKVFTGSIELSYNPQQRYRIRNNIKSYAASTRTPTFSLLYEKGFNGPLSSDVDFDFLRFSVAQRIEVGVNDIFRYNIRAGKFLNRNTLYAADYRFFDSNNQFFTFSDVPEKFYLSGYYELFSNKHFVEGHASFESYRLLLKLLPLLRDSFMQERLKVSYLASESVSNYMELSYTLKDIFFLFDVGFTVGFNDFENTRTGFRVVFNLK